MNKKQKQMAIVIGVVVVLVIVLFVALGGNESSAGVNPATLTEKQRYVKFEAEVACDLMTIDEGEDIFEAFARLEPIAEKYDFTPADLENLKTNYASDPYFAQLVVAEMEGICPDAVEKLGNIQ